MNPFLLFTKHIKSRWILLLQYQKLLILLLQIKNIHTNKPFFDLPKSTFIKVAGQASAAFLLSAILIFLENGTHLHTLGLGLIVFFLILIKELTHWLIKLHISWHWVHYLHEAHLRPIKVFKCFHLFKKEQKIWTEVFWRLENPNAYCQQIQGSLMQSLPCVQSDQERFERLREHLKQLGAQTMHALLLVHCEVNSVKGQSALTPHASLLQSEESRGKNRVRL